ncbi:PAS and ANTAR domain-containing protein [Arthrobacter humicola]
MTWSDELYSIHGYRRGDVVPTMELTMAHKHPDDLPRIQEVSNELFAHGGHVAMYHRLIDATSRERKVLTAGEAVLDGTGKLSTISGAMLDLTSTIQRETELAAREAVRGAMATRSTIAKAEGILMGRLGIGSDEAFKLLTTYSNTSNIKLAGVASGLVALADSPAEATALGHFIQQLSQTRQRR